MSTNAPPRTPVLFGAWLAIFAGIALLLWAAIQFWGRNLNLAPSHGAAAVQPTTRVRVLPPQNNVPVMKLEEVTESNARLSFVGRRVQFDDVIVTEVGERFFSVGRNSEKSLIVKTPEPERPDVRPGEKLFVSGLILTVPDAATIQKEWMLDPAQAAQIERELVYLRAPTIERR